VSDDAAALAEAVAGAFLGALSSLAPGFHVNTLAAFATGAPAPFLVAAFVSAGFAALAAGVFLGAPDEGAAAANLPAHALLHEGRGHEAVRRLVSGALAGFLLALALLPLFAWAFQGRDALRLLSAATPWALVALLALFLATDGKRLAYRRAWRIAPAAPERRVSGRVVARDGAVATLADGTRLVDDLGWIEGDVVRDAPVAATRVHGPLSRALGLAPGLAVMLLAGALGQAALALGAESPLGLPGGTMLLPLLAGLFGAPALVLALGHGAAAPTQLVADRVPPPRAGPLAAGALSASLVGLLPTLSAGHAVAVAFAAARGRVADRETALAVTGAAAGGAMAWSVAAWLALGRARSGALAAAPTPERWSPLWPAPPDATTALTAALVGALLGFALARFAARGLARMAARTPPAALPAGALALLALASWAFTGAPGLVVLATGTAVGLLPWRWGVRRTHAMAALTLPVLERAWL